MKITNVFGLPEPFVRAVVNDPYDPGTCDISVTRLCSSPRKVALEALHAPELTEDVADRVWSLFGQGIHAVLERAETKAMTETRLTIERQGWIISGQFDRFSVANGLLQEFKVTSTYSVKDGGRQEWEAQLNVLAHILREHGYSVSNLQVAVILRDWRRSLADRTQDYPPCPIFTIDVPMWTEEKCEEFLDYRIRLHQDARTTLPECSEDERWSTPETFALMREGRKTAVRVFDNQASVDEALELAGPKHWIEFRPGRNIRCESYCPVAPFCEQYKKLRGA